MESYSASSQARSGRLNQCCSRWTRSMRSSPMGGRPLPALGNEAGSAPQAATTAPASAFGLGTRLAAWVCGACRIGSDRPRLSGSSASCPRSPAWHADMPSAVLRWGLDQRIHRISGPVATGMRQQASSVSAVSSILLCRIATSKYLALKLRLPGKHPQNEQIFHVAGLRRYPLGLP